MDNELEPVGQKVNNELPLPDAVDNGSQSADEINNEPLQPDLVNDEPQLGDEVNNEPQLVDFPRKPVLLKDGLQCHGIFPYFDRYIILPRSRKRKYKSFGSIFDTIRKPHIWTYENPREQLAHEPLLEVREDLQEYYSKVRNLSHIPTVPACTIFVARLSPQTTEEKLRNEFQQRFEGVKSVTLVKKQNGRSKKYAFVEFDTKVLAETAYNVLHESGQKIDGEVILVDLERGRRQNGWLPRGKGMGLGGKPRAKRVSSRRGKNGVKRREAKSNSRPTESGTTVQEATTQSTTNHTSSNAIPGSLDQGDRNPLQHSGSRPDVVFGDMHVMPPNHGGPQQIHPLPSNGFVPSAVANFVNAPAGGGFPYYRVPPPNYKSCDQIQRTLTNNSLVPNVPPPYPYPTSCLRPRIMANHMAPAGGSPLVHHNTNAVPVPITPSIPLRHHPASSFQPAVPNDATGGCPHHYHNVSNVPISHTHPPMPLRYHPVNGFQSAVRPVNNALVCRTPHVHHVANHIQVVSPARYSNGKQRIIYSPASYGPIRNRFSSSNPVNNAAIKYAHRLNHTQHQVQASDPTSSHHCENGNHVQSTPTNINSTSNDSLDEPHSDNGFQTEDGFDSNASVEETFHVYSNTSDDSASNSQDSDSPPTHHDTSGNQVQVSEVQASDVTPTDYGISNNQALVNEVQASQTPPTYCVTSDNQIQGSEVQPDDVSPTDYDTGDNQVQGSEVQADDVSPTDYDTGDNQVQGSEVQADDVSPTDYDTGDNQVQASEIRASDVSLTHHNTSDNPIQETTVTRHSLNPLAPDFVLGSAKRAGYEINNSTSSDTAAIEDAACIDYTTSHTQASSTPAIHYFENGNVQINDNAMPNAPPAIQQNHASSFQPVFVPYDDGLAAESAYNGHDVRAYGGPSNHNFVINPSDSFHFHQSTNYVQVNSTGMVYVDNSQNIIQHDQPTVPVYRPVPVVPLPATVASYNRNDYLTMQHNAYSDQSAYSAEYAYGPVELAANSPPGYYYGPYEGQPVPTQSNFSLPPEFYPSQPATYYPPAHNFYPSSPPVYDHTSLLPRYHSSPVTYHSAQPVSYIQPNSNPRSNIRSNLVCIV